MLSKGILLGLSLSLLVGPLIFALLDASIRQGFRAGMAVGVGIWVSDALFILLTYFGLTYVLQITSWPGFTQSLGLIGGLVLMLFGGGAVWKARRARGVVKEHPGQAKRSYLNWWVKGFLINTINPFTVFFWTGVAGTTIAKPEFQPTDAVAFYSGLFCTIIATDTLKVLLAKAIRKKLNRRVVSGMQLVSGLVIFFFGLALIVRVYWFPG